MMEHLMSNTYLHHLLFAALLHRHYQSLKRFYTWPDWSVVDADAVHGTLVVNCVLILQTAGKVILIQMT